MEDEEGPNLHSAYREGQQELYEWMNEAAKEWYDLKIITAEQYLPMLELLHEVDKKVYYKFDG